MNIGEHKEHGNREVGEIESGKGDLVTTNVGKAGEDDADIPPQNEWH